MREIPIDYLQGYVTDQGFDVPRLIHDDFFEAVKLCFNAGKYMSCAKLLMCFIDAMGFLRFGDHKDNSYPFKEWCRAYVNLDVVGITPEELWEHRNALIHTTTLRSRKVRSGGVPMLVAYVGQLPPNVSAPVGEKWFDLHALLKEVGRGTGPFISNWVINEIELFVERYDQVVSDVRLLRINVE